MKGYNSKIKIKPENEEAIEWINLIIIIRDYYNQILELHKCFRNITQALYFQAIQCIKQIVISTYGDIIVDKVAFLGKEDAESFLLQMSYINKIKGYREKDIVLDTSKYLISKKSIINFNNLKLTNSQRVSLRYNM